MDRDRIDYDALRGEIMNQFGAEMVTFSGAIGFSDMLEAEYASDDELLQLAQREGIDLNNYMS